MAGGAPVLVKGPIDVEDLMAKVNAVLDFGTKYGDPGQFGDRFSLEVDWNTRGPQKDVTVCVDFSFPYNSCGEAHDLGYLVYAASTFRECMKRFHALGEVLERRFSLEVDLDEEGGTIVIRSKRPL
jgi:hypothetical protein